MRAFSIGFIRLLLLLVLARASHGAENSATTNAVVEPRAPAPLELKRVDETAPGIPNAFRIYGISGTNRFALLQPAGFRMEAVGQEMLLLIAPDQVGYISVRIVDAVVRKSVPIEVLKEKAVARFGQIDVVEEFTMQAAEGVGPALEFKWLGPENYPMQARVSLVPTAIGVLEFVASSPPGSISAAHGALNTVLATFRASAGGELKITPLSNRY